MSNTKQNIMATDNPPVKKVISSMAQAGVKGITSNIGYTKEIKKLNFPHNPSRVDVKKSEHLLPSIKTSLGPNKPYGKMRLIEFE